MLDFGCFHTLPEDRRDPYVRGVSDAAASGATLLLYGFANPPRLAPMRAEFTPEEVGRRFGPMGWELLRADRMSADAIVISGRRVDDRFQLWRCRLLHRM